MTKNRKNVVSDADIETPPVEVGPVSDVDSETPPVEVEPVSDAKAEEFKERAEADFDPVETATDRLKRLDAETKETMKAARKEVRDERKLAAREESFTVIAPELAKIDEIRIGIEEKTGKVFRSFSYVYKFPKGASEPELKVRYSLITPRGESTADDEETDEAANSEEADEAANSEEADEVASNEEG